MAAIALLCIGLVVTAISAAVLSRALKLPLLGRKTSGTLVGWRHAFHHKWLPTGHFTRSSQYFPVIEFKATDGSRHTVVGCIGYDTKPDWPVGRPFAVRYAAGNPNDATIDPVSPIWVFSAVFLAAGIVVLISAF